MNKSDFIDRHAVLYDMWARLYAKQDELEKKIGVDFLLHDRPVLQLGHALAVNAVSDAPAVDAVRVVRCKDCKHCYSLTETDPMTPYDGSGDGSFYCEAFDMEFYAPRYDAATYYCADGERRED